MSSPAHEQQLAATVSRTIDLVGAGLVLFGLGTTPAVFGVSVADGLLARRAILNRLSQVFLLVMGVWFVWTGLA